MYLPAPLVLILFGFSCLCAWPANWPVGPQWANPANRLRWWLDRSHSLIARISHNGMIVCAAYMATRCRMRVLSESKAFPDARYNYRKNLLTGPRTVLKIFHQIPGT